MEITVQVTVKSQAGEPALVQEVARLERGPLRSDTPGLSLAEARSILAGLEQTLAERQAAEFVTQERRCPRCGQERACEGHHAIVFRTPFGKLQLDSPRLYRCGCELHGARSFSPLAELLPERASPELRYLETKFADPYSPIFGFTISVLTCGRRRKRATSRYTIHGLRPNRSAACSAASGDTGSSCSARGRMTASRRQASCPCKSVRSLPAWAEFLHLSANAGTLAERFNCKVFLHLIGQPEGKGIRRPNGLTANDTTLYVQTLALDGG